MNEKLECMCLNCGISNYLDGSDLFLEEIPDWNKPLVRNCPCPECGGVLTVVGRAGEEARYRV
jgi:hypothetical protein